MDLNKKVLALLAIFCIIASAGIVCAADYGGYAGSNYQDMNGVSGSQYYVNEGSQKVLEPGAGLPLENQTYNGTGNASGANVHNTTHNATHNTTHHASGEKVHNTTGNTSNNTTHAPNKLAATGNPILALIAVTALIGGYSVLRKNK